MYSFFVKKLNAKFGSKELNSTMKQLFNDHVQTVHLPNRRLSGLWAVEIEKKYSYKV